MSMQCLLPTHEQLVAVVEKTGRFLDYLRDAELIEGANPPPVPQSTIAYRKGNVVFRWAEWEQALNPSSAPFGGPPTELAAGGWVDWQALHLALVDLYAFRKEIITLWGLASLVGSKSVQLSYEAIGSPGSGGKALFLHAETGSASGIPGHVRLEKPLDWPLPIPLQWREQCLYALQRINEVMETEGLASKRAPSNGTRLPAAERMNMSQPTTPSDFVTILDHMGRQHSIELAICTYHGPAVKPDYLEQTPNRICDPWIADRLMAGRNLEVWETREGIWLVVDRANSEGRVINGDQLRDLRPTPITTTTPAPRSEVSPLPRSQPMTPPGTIEVFFSYSHRDERLRDALSTHLSQLKHEKKIRDWHDRRIGAGTEWEGEISEHLNSAHIILLLISPDFLGSRYCYDVEMKRTLERHAAGEARVIPVILRSCDWHGAPFGKLQALPTDGKPVTNWRNRDEAFTVVAKGIRSAVEELSTGS